MILGKGEKLLYVFIVYVYASAILFSIMSYTRTIGCVWQYDCASKIFQNTTIYLQNVPSSRSVCMCMRQALKMCHEMFVSFQKKKKMRNLAVL